MRVERVGLGIVLTALAVMAQDNAPSGFLRGELVSWSGTSPNGQFTFRTASDHVYSCSYDDKSYFERDHERITLRLAEHGDRLELLSDRKLGSPVCYARIVHILAFEPIVAVPGVRPRLTTAARTSSLFTLRPALSLSGVVLRITPDALTLRSRSGEPTLIRLRPDTGYMAEGQIADLASLRANTIVFVSGGKNGYGEVEAYRIIWGAILQPVQ